MNVRFFRYVLFFIGLIFYGLGNALAIKVKFLGIHPWEVLNVALFQHFGITIGTWGVLCGLFLVIISLFMDRKYINIGTFLNAIMIGPIMDLFLHLNILPDATPYLAVNLLILFAGIAITGIGGGMYVAAGIGAGPRDGFMLSISDKTGLSVSKSRILVESIVLLIGFFLGGPVFIMTFLYTFFQSPVFQKSLHIFQLFIKAIENKRKSHTASM
ncbi:YczE/YyaS/YitT family protein [Metabacillus sp. RGM 3146]|uniref:YczE/YyaS/YitT family protein n=1 Tax=Metabacillus sp. RGM 3146 TaxID=3401092 RepID=UPI003B9CD380